MSHKEAELEGKENTVVQYIADSVVGLKRVHGSHTVPVVLRWTSVRRLLPALNVSISPAFGGA